LWLRLVDAGATFHFIDEVTVQYRKHGESGTADRLLMQKRLGAFAEKNLPRILPRMGFATWNLAQRIDGLESRLNRLQRNPVIKVLSCLQRMVDRRG
jgi:hypothetical protein